MQGICGENLFGKYMCCIAPSSVPLKGSAEFFSGHLFTELLLMAASVSPQNLVLHIINYAFDFLLQCWYFKAISVHKSLDNFYDDVVELPYKNLLVEFFNLSIL